jgi:hypothetical protein
VRAIIITVILAICIPVIASASNVGDRARDISGWDMVSHRTVSLADYEGKWVLLVFWASW